MLIKVQRFLRCATAYIGVLSYWEASPKASYTAECFTLEDQPRPIKVPGETCIPVGSYALKLRPFGNVYERYLARFPFNAPGMLWLQDVPGFTDVLIHCGNTDHDTAGCILVGDGAFMRGEVTQSTDAYRRVYARVVESMRLNEPVTLEVRE